MDSAKLELLAHDFQEIRETDSWSGIVRPGGKYFVTRDQSSIVAFAVGKLWKPGNPFAMIAAHTDSPCLKIRPISKGGYTGFLQVGAETYGGGLWHTWFDRDLGIAGRVMIQIDPHTIESRLVQIDEPVLRIPSLAMHYGRQNPFDFHEDIHLYPVAGMREAENDRKIENEAEAEDPDSQPEPGTTIYRHHPFIAKLLAAKLGVHPHKLIEFDLSLYDVQKASIGGANKELIFASRLDNLTMTFCALKAFTRSTLNESALDQEESIRLISFFDNEEVGSVTSRGGWSNFLPNVLKRLALLPSQAASESTNPEMPTALEQSLAKSFLISADMIHGVHPNYPSRHDGFHKPLMNAGPVVSSTAQRNSLVCDAPAWTLIREVIHRSWVPLTQNSYEPDLPTPSSSYMLQRFVPPNSVSCGTSLGPILSASLGVRTIDLGNCQLSMHSIRETAGRYDIYHAVALFENFFNHYTKASKVFK